MSLELSGRTILITRSRPQASEFTRLLEAAGARVVETPTIEIRPRMSPRLDEAIRHIAGYDWLMLTSPNGAKIFLERARELGGIPAAPPPRVCTIGPATAAAVEEFGLRVDLTPGLYQAEGVLEDFAKHHGGRIEGLKILLPRASKAREILPRRLREQGALVDLIPVYDTVLPEDGRRRLRQALEGPPPDLVTFTSSSTVHNFVAMADQDVPLRNLRYAAIGPITAATAADYGLRVVVQPEKSTIPDLVEAIRESFRPQTDGPDQ